MTRYPQPSALLSPPLRPRLRRAAVVEAGLQIARDDGIEAVTMRSVAGRLGVAPMALYRHVPNKSVLLEEMVGVVYRDMELPLGGPWRDRVLRVGEAIRDAGRAHPGASSLLLHHFPPPRMVNPVPLTIGDALLEGGVDRSEVVMATGVLVTTYLAFASSEGSPNLVMGAPLPSDAGFAMTQRMVGQFIDDLVRSGRRRRLRYPGSRAAPNRAPGPPAGPGPGTDLRSGSTA
jgi:AcrR family transcriptional regulator